MEVSIGKDAPKIVNVVIEIQQGKGRNKYEVDKQTGRLTLDRVNATMLGYPADYGFVPDTLCEDGDPLDALVLIDESLVPGAVAAVRPIGVLRMIDEGEHDEKIVAVAAKDVSKDHLKNVADLGENFKQVVEHFYTHYKDWKNGWKGTKVEFEGWGDAAAAEAEIEKAMRAHQGGQ